MTLKNIIIISIYGIAPSLSAQSALGDEQENQWQLVRRDTLRSDTVWQAAAPLYIAPLGDFRLRRFRPSVFRFDTVPAGDTLSVALTTAAEPFNKVELDLVDSVITQLGVPVFKHQSQAGISRKPVLSIKNKMGFKRSMANLEARSTPPQRAIMRFTVRETLTQPNGDTITRNWITGEYGEKILVDEQKVQRYPNGHIHRKSKTVTQRTTASQPIALSPGGIQTLPRKGERVFRYSEFDPGDTLLFHVTAIGAKPLKWVLLSNDKQQYRREARETAQFSDKVVANKKTKYWELRLKSNWGLQKKNVDISVLRIPPARKDAVVRSIDTVFRVETIPLYDTLVLLVKDDSLLLTPELNLLEKNVASTEIAIPKTLPKGFNLMFAAYWIGINRPCLNTYQALEEMVPAEWAKPGVPPALCAYALNMPLQLPPINLSDVVLAFNKGGAYPKDKSGAMPLWGVSVKHSMGILSADALNAVNIRNGTYHFYASFKNNNRVNTYPVKVKIIAFYRKKKGEETKTTILSIDNH